MQLTVTTPRREDAEGLADMLLTRRLAACVQILGPLESRYVWNGAIEHTPEYLMLVKTTGARAAGATAAIVDAHPYDVPEVLITTVLDGHRQYLDWVTDTVD